MLKYDVEIVLSDRHQNSCFSEPSFRSDIYSHSCVKDNNNLPCSICEFIGQQLLLPSGQDSPHNSASACPTWETMLNPADCQSSERPSHHAGGQMMTLKRVELNCSRSEQHEWCSSPAYFFSLHCLLLHVQLISVKASLTEVVLLGSLPFEE